MGINKRLRNEVGGNKYGAFMGRPDLRGDPDRAYKFRLELVRFYDGDYDAGGAYWGNSVGSPLWCAWCDDEEDGEVRMFLRFKSRDGAKLEVKGYYGNAKFYR